MKSKNGWFEVDRAGLRQLYEGKPKSFVIRELVQNAWDEPGVSKVNVFIEKVGSTPFAQVAVEDDAPEGFADLSHAFTLFANTRKRPDAEKRGRFNLGEKQVLALCKSASIQTTKGAVLFDEDGVRRHRSDARPSGSVFEGTLRMTKAEVDEAIRAVNSFLPPAGIETRVNGELVERREPVSVIEAILATEVADAEGNLRESKRKTKVEVVAVREGERATLYEMGLPVIETGDEFHYNVMQRVPLTVDRDNVRPSFLQDVRAEVLNVVIKEVSDASAAWVREAAEDDRAKPEVFSSVLDKRFGERRVVADPRDPESRDRAIAAGFALVAPGSLSKREWERARESNAVPSSSSLFGTKVVEAETVDELTEEMKRVRRLTEVVAEIGIREEVNVQFVRAPGASTAAQYGARTVTFNVSNLGVGWFKKSNVEEHLRLIIHELGHEFGSHLTAGYYEGLARIGARLALVPREELFPESEVER